MSIIHPSADVADCIIGEGTNIWQFVVILKGASIGKECNICAHSLIEGDVVIGDRVTIKSGVFVWNGITIEDDVFCGPSMVFTNVSNPRASIEKKDEFMSTIVKKGATLGANSTIICGLTLGQYCFVAAGAVVTKDVEPFALMAGVPAKKIGWMNKKGERVSNQPKINI